MLKLQEKYPDYAFIRINSLSPKEITINHEKLMVPKDMTLSYFIFRIKVCNFIKTEKQINIISFINKTIPCPSTMIGHLYNRYKDENEILHLSLMTENVFG